MPVRRTDLDSGSARRAVAANEGRKRSVFASENGEERALGADTSHRGPSGLCALRWYAMRTPTIVLALSVVALVGLVALFRLGTVPPRDETLVKSFREHKIEYERLRDMLQADDKLRRVASWGIETSGSPGTAMPPTAELTLNRYNEYLVLLKKVGGEVASRSGGSHPDACVSVWASGWAADTRHVAVCWIDELPAGVDASSGASLTTARRDNKSRAVVSTRIEGNWYLRKDL